MAFLCYLTMKSITIIHFQFHELLPRRVTIPVALAISRLTHPSRVPPYRATAHAHWSV